MVLAKFGGTLLNGAIDALDRIVFYRSIEPVSAYL